MFSLITTKTHFKLEISQTSKIMIVGKVECKEAPSVPIGSVAFIHVFNAANKEVQKSI